MSIPESAGAGVASPSDSAVVPTYPARKKPTLCIARPVGLGTEHPDTGTYLAYAAMQAGNTGRFSSVHLVTSTQHRIMEARNYLTEKAMKADCDYLFFLDPDMDPLEEVGQPHYKPFLETATDFLEELRMGVFADQGLPAGSLGIIAAPALSGPPEYKCNVFEGDPEHLIRVTQRQAMNRKGSIDRVVAIGTAVMLIPMEVFRRIPQPWFDDIYENGSRSKVWVTQDINFCQKCNEHGISVWCSWYAFATHFKTVGVTRPDKHLIAMLEERERENEAKLRDENSGPGGETSGPEGALTLAELIRQERQVSEGNSVAAATDNRPA